MAVSVQQKLLGIDVSVSGAEQLHELGIEVQCDDGTTRRYVRAGAAIAQYDALTQDFAEGIDNWHPTAAADTPVLGIAQAAVTDNHYFWAVVRGKAYCKVAATVVVGAALVPTATAGTLDDTAAAAANALAMGQGVGVTLVLDDSPSAGIGLVYVA